MKALIVIDQFNKGILSDPTIPDTAGGQAFVGVDIHRDDSILQVSQKLTAETGTFTDLIKWIVRDENDATYKYYALGDTGNIYRVSDIGGTWALSSNVSGHGNGLAIYNGERFYATDTGLVGSGGTSKTLDSDTLWHPMAVYLGCLWIGAGRYLAKLESDGTFTARKLTLPAGVKIKSMDTYGDRLVLGTIMGSSLTDKAESYLFTYPGTGDFPEQNFYLEEHGMNALISWENILLDFAGIQGNLYAFNNAFLDKAKQIPNVFPMVGDYVFVNPGAVAQYGGNILAGISVGSGSALGGVFVFGRKTEDLPFAMTLSNPISTGYTDVEIGAIMTAGANKFLVSWKRGTSYGLDLLNTAAKYTSGYFTSQKYEVMNGNKPKLIKGVSIVAEPLPASTSITVEYDADDSGTFTSGGTITSSNQTEMLPLTVRAKVFQIKLTLNCSSNSSPKIKRIEIF